MATADSQGMWRSRKEQGLVTTEHCCSCGKRLRIDSSHKPLCRDCWYKTDKGKAYLAERQNYHRKNKLN